MTNVMESQASVPKRNQRESPVEQLRERSRVERKKTISKSSTRTRKEYMRNQVGDNGENVEAKVETYTETAAVRQNQQERKERNRRLSSRK